MKQKKKKKWNTEIEEKLTPKPKAEVAIII